MTSKLRQIICDAFRAAEHRRCAADAKPLTESHHQQLRLLPPLPAQVPLIADHADAVHASSNGAAGMMPAGIVMLDFRQQRAVCVALCLPVALGGATVAKYVVDKAVSVGVFRRALNNRHGRWAGGAGLYVERKHGNRSGCSLSG